VSSRREWEPVYEKHPKLSALSRVTRARESARPSWRRRAPFPQSRMPASIEEFNKAKCMYAKLNKTFRISYLLMNHIERKNLVQD
jgi:hypothetical protein